MYNTPHTFTLDRIITYLSLLYVKSYTSSKFQLIYDFFKDQIPRNLFNWAPQAASWDPYGRPSRDPAGVEAGRRIGAWRG